MWSAYFYMGVYKCDVVVVIKIGAYVYSWMFILRGCLLFQFYEQRTKQPGLVQFVVYS